MNVPSKRVSKSRRKHNSLDKSDILKQLSSLTDNDAKLDLGNPLGLAKFMYSWRRRRDQILGQDLFGEPSTDILLAAYIADACKNEFRVTEAVRASASPATTALRYIAALEAEGLLSRLADINDARIFHLHLTAKGKRMLTKILSVKPRETL